MSICVPTITVVTRYLMKSALEAETSKVLDAATSYLERKNLQENRLTGDVNPQSLVKMHEYRARRQVMGSQAMKLY